MARRAPRNPAQLLVTVALFNLHDADRSWLRAGRDAVGAVTAIGSLAVEFHKTGEWSSTARQHAERQGFNERQVQREWELFRQAFPGEESPLRLAQFLYSQLGPRIADTRALLSQPAPPDLQPAIAS